MSCVILYIFLTFHFILATKNLKLWSIPRSSRWRQSRVWKVDRHPPLCTSRGSPSWAARTQSPCPSPTLWTTWAWTGPQITSWSTSPLWDVIIDGASNSVSRSISPTPRNLDSHTRNITRRWARYPAIKHYRDRQDHYKPSKVLTLDPVPPKSNKTFNRPILSSYLNDYLFAFLCLLTTLLLRIIGALRK